MAEVFKNIPSTVQFLDLSSVDFFCAGSLDILDKTLPSLNTIFLNDFFFKFLDDPQLQTLRSIVSVAKNVVFIDREDKIVNNRSTEKDGFIHQPLSLMKTCAFFIQKNSETVPIPTEYKKFIDELVINGQSRFHA